MILSGKNEIKFYGLFRFVPFDTFNQKHTIILNFSIKIAAPNNIIIGINFIKQQKK